jgi:hypothetical protein
MENRPEERNELVERARHALEHPGEVEPRGDLHRYSQFLRLWRYPAFGPWNSWTLFEPGRYADDPEAFRLRQITWDQRSDLGRFGDPMEWLRQGYRAPPTLDVVDATVSRVTLKPYLDGLAHVRIPLLQGERYVMLDGEERGVEAYGFAVSARVVWRPGAEHHTSAVFGSLDLLIDLLRSVCQHSRQGE